MWSAGSLKVVNSENSEVLQELLADCRNVSFFSLSNEDDLILVGYNGSTLHFFSFSNLEKSQVIHFDDADIVSTSFSSKGIYAILGSNRIAFITKSEELWENKSVHSFAVNERKIVACFPLPIGIIIFIQQSVQSNGLIVGLSENPPEWHEIARIDCLQVAESVCVCISPMSVPQSTVILIGTRDGHVYQLQIRERSLTLLCDVEQPVTSILNVDSQITVIVGKYGKIAMLNGSTKETLISFAPTAIEDCFFSKHQLYLMGSNQLFSMELKTSGATGFLGEASYCNVKFIRSFHVKNETVFILTENGTIYQSSLIFGSKEVNLNRERNGAEVKPILQEIHRSADRTKALSTISDRFLLDVAQLSIALHMVNQDVSSRFPVTIRSFSDPRIPQSQNLIVSITNKSEWSLSSLYWKFQICIHRTNQSSVLLREEWKMGETVELEHQMILPDDTFDAEVKISFIFRIIDMKKQSEPQSLCFFPLSTIKLSALDFLEPAVPNLFDEKKSISDVLGFSRTQIRGCPWPILLQQSWHRGFAQKFGYTSPLQMVLRCGSHLVRMVLKEDENHSDKIWVLRIETTNFKLLRLLCAQIFQLIEARHPPTKSDFVNIPSYVLAQLQNLKGRLNYIQSLSNWDESDMEPLMEEFRLLMAKQFFVR